MPVTDEQVAPLRAQLSRRPEEHLRLFDQLDPDAKKTGYRMLVSAAFVVAAHRRFSRPSAAEIIEFVGDVRSRSAGVAEQVDPQIAERVIGAVFNDDSLDDIDARVNWETQIVLMAAIVGDEQLDDAGLEKFLSEAREVADEWLSP